MNKLDTDTLKHVRNFLTFLCLVLIWRILTFLNPGEESEEIHYLKEKREQLGGFLDERKEKTEPFLRSSFSRRS